MSDLIVTKTYTDDQTVPLFEADLDNACNSIETFFNVTKLTNSNVQDLGISVNNLDFADGTYIVDSPTLAVALNSIDDNLIPTASIPTAKIDPTAAIEFDKFKTSAQTATTAALNEVAVSPSSSGTSTVVAGIIDSLVASCTVTTSGRPLLAAVRGIGAGSYIKSTQLNGANISPIFSTTPSGGSRLSHSLGTATVGLTVPYLVPFPSEVIPVAAGTTTIYFRLIATSNGTVIEWNDVELVVYEL